MTYLDAHALRELCLSLSRQGQVDLSVSRLQHLCWTYNRQCSTDILLDVACYVCGLYDHVVEGCVVEARCIELLCLDVRHYQGYNGDDIDLTTLLRVLLWLHGSCTSEFLVTIVTDWEDRLTGEWPKDEDAVLETLEAMEGNQATYEAGVWSVRDPKGLLWWPTTAYERILTS